MLGHRPRTWPEAAGKDREWGLRHVRIIEVGADPEGRGWLW